MNGSKQIVPQTLRKKKMRRRGRSRIEVGECGREEQERRKGRKLMQGK